MLYAYDRECERGSSKTNGLSFKMIFIQKCVEYGADEGCIRVNERKKKENERNAHQTISTMNKLCREIVESGMNQNLLYFLYFR